MFRVQMELEAATWAELQQKIASVAGAVISSEAPKATRTRAGKKDGDGAAAPDAAIDTAPTAQEDPDLAAPPPPSPPKAQFETADQFVDAVKKLLGKGKDDQVRAHLRKLGFEKVRDVPADKWTSVLAELSKV